MHGATEEGKQALTVFVGDLMRNPPPLTFLSMASSGFDSQSIAAISEAIINANLTSLTWISLANNPAYFDTFGKCVAWAAVF